ncbi:MAG TPA: FixH family protein [Mucilaginibacter sp.]|nr:FixH family protein [Mucilaginibacter sp.]
MNWGKGIVTGMIIFMLFISGMVVFMFLSPTDDYDHQYYEKGLGFDHDYDREKQVVKDHAQPLIRITDDSIKFTFPHPVKGTIKFERPSNNTLDKVYQLNSGGSNEVDISIDPLASGKWKLVFDWKSNNKAYLYQQEIYIK